MGEMQKFTDKSAEFPETNSFEEDDPRREARDGALVLDLQGFEGPIDLLLILARKQKVDLAQISILAVAEQYLAFIEKAHKLQIELAADYLVMAAWLAYLKSRLLLPDDPGDELGAEAMAERLTHHLRQLDSMREAGIALFERPQKDKAFFGPGMPEHIPVLRRPVYALGLYEMLAVYGASVQRDAAEDLQYGRGEYLSLEEAMVRLSRIAGRLPEWRALVTFLPESMQGPFAYRSAIATTLAAALELVKSGRMALQQGQPFAPIYLKSSPEELSTNG